MEAIAFAFWDDLPFGATQRLICETCAQRFPQAHEIYESPIFLRVKQMTKRVIIIQHCAHLRVTKVVPVKHHLVGVVLSYTVPSDKEVYEFRRAINALQSISNNPVKEGSDLYDLVTDDLATVDDFLYRYAHLTFDLNFEENIQVEFIRHG